MEKMEYVVNLNLYMPMREGETEEEAKVRFADALSEALMLPPDYNMDYQIWEDAAVKGFMECGYEMDYTPAELTQTLKEVRENNSTPDIYCHELLPVSREHSIGGTANLSQFIWGATGCVLPRNLHKFDNAALQLRLGGNVTDQSILDMATLAMSIAAASKNRYDVDHFYEEDEDLSELINQRNNADNASTEEEEAENAPEQSVEELQAELRRMKEKVSDLKRDLHSAESKAREYKEDYEHLSAEYEAEHRELADLRERVFNMDQTEEPEMDDAANAIQFPYSISKNIVVFGGHDTWSKAIKPRLPDVRFISRNMRPDPNLVRYADTVWIQPNALGHKDFYSIINVVRKYNIPIRYFSYASPDKCARQLVMDAENAG